jgi:hypothetical protein
MIRHLIMVIRLVITQGVTAGTANFFFLWFSNASSIDRRRDQAVWSCVYAKIRSSALREVGLG